MTSDEDNDADGLLKFPAASYGKLACKENLNCDSLANRELCMTSSLLKNAADKGSIVWNFRMPFKKILKELTDKSGAKGSIMLDYDGEVVASYSEAEALEIDLIGAHHGIILNIIKDVAARSSGGAVNSVSISTDTHRLAISSIKDGYYLVMAIDKRSPAGKAAFEARRAVKKLEEEMG